MTRAKLVAFDLRRFDHARPAFEPNAIFPAEPLPRWCDYLFWLLGQILLSREIGEVLLHALTGTALDLRSCRAQEHYACDLMATRLPHAFAS
jgi:hypothetical protein